MAITSAETLKQYYQHKINAARRRTGIFVFIVIIFFSSLGYVGGEQALYIIAGLAGVAVVGFYMVFNRKPYQRLSALEKQFPADWTSILEKHSVFYQNLDSVKKKLFETRVQLFLAEKRVEGIDMEINDEIRLLVASSAIIPTFAFPAFNYPELNEVLVYPASFSKNFEIGGNNKREQNIEGMVGNLYMNHSLLLSAPALLSGFSGRPGEENVGIHEFVHLLDREDGDTDGVPERLMQHAYTLPWLKLIKDETDRIKRGRSDINPYAITNNAEFLAVVSEYFFNDPEEFQERHPELYGFLSKFYGQAL